MTTLHEFKAEFFKVLGHPLRLRVLDALRDGEKSVTTLREELNVEQSTLSQHLAVLRRGGFLLARKEGTVVNYSAKDPDVYTFLDFGRRLFERHLESSQQVLVASQEAEGPPS